VFRSKHFFYLLRRPRRNLCKVSSSQRVSDFNQNLNAMIVFYKRELLSSIKFHENPFTSSLVVRTDRHGGTIAHIYFFFCEVSLSPAQHMFSARVWVLHASVTVPLAAVAAATDKKTSHSSDAFHSQRESLPSDSCRALPGTRMRCGRSQLRYAFLNQSDHAPFWVKVIALVLIT
jgi:hypothetical protein